MKTFAEVFKGSKHFVLRGICLVSPLVTFDAFAQVQATGPAQIEQAAGIQQIKDLYNAGSYQAVGKLGARHLLSQPENNELRYMVANSFAWTGRFPQAVAQYKALAEADYASRANLGLANVYRWNGIHGLAVPLYRQVLAAEPENKDAAEGLTYSMREVRPQTFGRGVYLNDSLDTTREGAIVGQRWTSASNRHTFEIEAGALWDERNGLRVRQRDLALRYAGMATPLKPRVEISAQESPHNSLFARGEMQLPNMPVTIGLGRLNWGKMAFDPIALQADLTANSVSGQASFPTAIGWWRMGYQRHRVSDSNLIQDATIQYTPAWQPIKKPEVKLFMGFEGRKARFNSPAYWSPRDGNYIGTIGVNAEWLGLLWERTVLLQYGVPLGGEAETNYSAGVGIKRWIKDGWALAFNLSYQKAQRTGAYRASGATLSIQRLW